eukprot:1709585-Pleurochrysis_carterae.AAC.1
MAPLVCRGRELHNLSAAQYALKEEGLIAEELRRRSPVYYWRHTEQACRTVFFNRRASCRCIWFHAQQREARACTLCQSALSNHKTREILFRRGAPGRSTPAPIE